MLYTWNPRKEVRKVHIVRDNGESLCGTENTLTRDTNEFSDAMPAGETLCGNCQSRLDWACAVNKQIGRRTKEKSENVVPSEKRGIPTVYEGQQFRSRLEAKWAKFFDLAGWQWTYEPFDLDGWIPDFSLSCSDEPVLVEIKPIDRFCTTTVAKIECAVPKVVRKEERLKTCFGPEDDWDPEATEQVSWDVWKYKVLVLGMTVPMKSLYKHPRPGPTLGYILCDVRWDDAVFVSRDDEQPWDFHPRDNSRFLVSGEVGDVFSIDRTTDHLNYIWRQAANETQWKKP